MPETVGALFFFLFCRSVVEPVIQPHYITFGHKRNEAEVVAAQLSAPVPVSDVAFRSVHFRKDVLRITSESFDKVCYLKSYQQKGRYNQYYRKHNCSAVFIHNYCISFLFSADDQGAQDALMPFDRLSTGRWRGPGKNYLL